MRKWVGLVAVVAFVAIGCSSKEPTFAPGTAHCTTAAMPEAAVVDFSSGSGWAGDRVWSVVAFPDGRLVVNEKVDAHVAPERISKLVADLEATGVKDQDEGCYYPTQTEYDAGGATLKLRDGGGSHVWSQSGSGEAPDEVFAAIRVGDAFIAELEAANVVPEQKNDG